MSTINLKNKLIITMTMLNKTIISLLLCLGLLSSTVQAADKVTYIHNDALGSPVAATDANGKLLWREDYKPYGERIRKETASKGNTLWYTGKPHEEDFGLSYFGARWYSPQMGRFTGIDPAGFSEGNVQSFNRYAYANNNPYRYVDPDGKESVESVKYRLATGMVLRNPAGGNGTSFPQLMTPVPGYSPAMNGAEAAANVLSLVEGGLALRAALKYGIGKLVAKSGDNFVDGYRAVSKAEADDIAAHGFRPNPNGQSMQDKWFSETLEGAEKFKKNYSDLDEVVKTKVPKDVYDRSYKHPNIDNTGPGFCVSCDDLHLLK